MRALIALLWSGLSAGLGLLGIWPSIPAVPRRRLALAQMVATEVPAIGLLAGVIGVWQGLRARSGRAVLAGAAGIALGIRPWLRRAAVNRAMADAMREGLGLGWQAHIPPAVHHTFPQHHRTDRIGPRQAWRLATHVRVTHDVLFAAPDGHPLRLDIYQPREADGTRPAVIVVHGGAWFQGDKGDTAFGLHNRWLAAQGYVVFDIQYRLGARWPAPLADVKCAIRWVKVNAARHGADPAQVAIMGRAAGAHLALMAAYTANDPAFGAGCFADTDPPIDESVQAVIVSHAPGDLRLWMAEQGSAIEQLMGGLPDDVPDVYEAAAPVTHIRPGLPPTLIIHGQRDRTVPPIHAELLANHLRAAGVTTVALRIPWGRHGVDSLLGGLTGPMIQYDIDRFLAWVFHRQEQAE